MRQVCWVTEIKDVRETAVPITPLWTGSYWLAGLYGHQPCCWGKGAVPCDAF